MKKFRWILLMMLCMSGVASKAEDVADFDGQRLAERDIQGTARYVSMGGAFTALGGDVSAVTDNPAALGVFRHSEISVTADGRLDYVSGADAERTEDRRMTLPQLSFVVCVGEPTKQTGVIYNNFILQYHRLKTYNRYGMFSSYTQNSQTDFIAQQTAGLEAVDMESNDGWHNENVGWLSKMGYEGYLIDPARDGEWQSAHSIGEGVEAQMEMYEGGVQNEFTAGWAMNYNNALYFGVSLNVRSLNYSRQTIYSELLENSLTNYKLYSNLDGHGWGMNVGLGVIYRATDYLRLGLAFSTPSVMHIDFENSCELKSNANKAVDGVIEVTSPKNFYTIKQLLEPMRLNVGVAFQIGYRCLISTGYEFDCKTKYQLYHNHTGKVGAEVAVKQNWFVRIGYACQSNFSNREYHYLPNVTDTRTDTDYFNRSLSHYFSAGAGWKNESWLVDFAYQCRWQQIDEYMYYKSSPIELDALTHRIVVSFGWTYRH